MTRHFAAASAVLRASGEWNALAVDGRLTEEDAQQIIAGAKSIAQQKTSKEDLSAVSLLPRLQHTGQLIMLSKVSAYNWVASVLPGVIALDKHS